MWSGFPSGDVYVHVLLQVVNQLCCGNGTAASSPHLVTHRWDAEMKNVRAWWRRSAVSVRILLQLPLCLFSRLVYHPRAQNQTASRNHLRNQLPDPNPHPVNFDFSYVYVWMSRILSRIHLYTTQIIISNVFTPSCAGRSLWAELEFV